MSSSTLTMYRTVSFLEMASVQYNMKELFTENRIKVNSTYLLDTSVRIITYMLDFDMSPVDHFVRYLHTEHAL